MIKACEDIIIFNLLQLYRNFFLIELKTCLITFQRNIANKRIVTIDFRGTPDDGTKG